VSQLYQEDNDLSLYTSCYDRVLMVLTLHDLFYVAPAQGWTKIDAPTLMNKINTSVKQGGLVGIIDHVAPIGSGEQAFQTLHRTDPQLIKDKMQQWGFTLICQANFLTNPDDSGKLSMWEETVKVKTNRAIKKFTKKT